MPGRTVIQWDKNDLDALGILKVDCLALGMLTAIRKALDLIRSHNPQGPAGLADVPTEDPAVYEMIQQADTIGVFQIESRAQMSMLPRLRPQCFYDLVIEVAIVRPGPIQGGMVHPYLRRRAGEEAVDYPSEEVRSVLEKTLGVVIFQEQAMRLAVVAAGFSPGEADQLRRAMGAWRKTGVIEKFRTQLITGMRERGYAEDFAQRLFQQIQGFGEYGFPESHAASFAALVYASAWIKRYYPAEFLAALLNSQPMGFYAPAQLVRDARQHGVAVLPVDINQSSYDCTLERSRGFQPVTSEVSNAYPMHEKCVVDFGSLAGQHVSATQDFRSLSPEIPAEIEPETSEVNQRPTLAKLPLMSESTREPEKTLPLPRKPRSSRINLDCGGEGRGEGDQSDVRFGPLTPALSPTIKSKAKLDTSSGGEGVTTYAHAVRLGFCQIRGLSQAVAEQIVTARNPGPFLDYDDFVRRTALSAAILSRLAQADVFASLQVGRREGLWRSMIDHTQIPLFATSPDAEPSVELPALSSQQQMMADYQTTGLSLRAHPLSFVRADLERRGVVTAKALNEVEADRTYRVAGLVLVKQRPGTAKGITFCTLEDETGTANLIVRQDVWERYRRVIRGAAAIVARGRLQRQHGVIHILTDRLEPLVLQQADTTKQTVIAWPVREFR